MIQPKTLASYVDPLSVQAGDTLRVMVSCHASGGYQADLVRLISGDSRPRGTGFIETPIAAQFEGRYEGREQPIAGGSFARLPGLPAVASFTFSALIYPTTPYRDGQVIVANERFRLRIEQAVLVLESGSARLTSTVPVAAMRWHAIELVAANGNVKIALRGFGQGAAERAQRASTVDMPLALEVPAGDWTLAGPGFNGCIEAPRLEDADGTLIAAWDFSRKMATDTIVDTSPHGRHGKLLQTPTRAVKGSRWDGSTQRWADDPSQYAAIHFHEDDLTDAGWKPDIEWRIPDDLPSGQYAVRLRSGEANQKHDGEPVAEHEEDHAVFFVRRAASGAKSTKRANSAKIVYLAATATYLAYANQSLHLRANSAPRNPSDAYQVAHPEVGLSLYDYHLDGSGVHYSSRLRPILNLKPKTMTWSFNADTNLTAWLEQLDHDYDVLTDEDLHCEGVDLLARYNVIVTGTHPEYYSTAMSDAMIAFLERGGRLMYMGGNGFYWRIAYDPQNPAIIEVRRAEDGTRAWMSQPGEYYHAFTGEFGGLWRRVGRPPNKIAGIGFAAQGFDGGTHYRLLEGARDPRVAFMLDGVVSASVIGDYGTQAGGAAGEEIDRWDSTLGSPSHAVIVATSEDHRSGMLRTIEEIHMTAYPGEDPLVRADMVFFETPAGGAVFATGSISYAGALSHNGYDNDIERLTRNVLERFADPTPFEYPE